MGNRMTKKIQLAIAYTRVSTDQQAESGLSLEAQSRAVSNWCEANDVKLSGIYEERGVSGSTPIEDRQRLLLALRQASTLGATHFIVARLDRLSRAPFILLTLEREFQRMGIKLVSAAGEGTANDDPASVLMRRMLQAVSEHELALISARTKAALAEKKQRGEWVGRPPYGFTTHEGGLVPNEDYIAVLDCVQRYRAGGITMRGLVPVMKDRYPGKRWHLKRVYVVLDRWLTQHHYRHLEAYCDGEWRSKAIQGGLVVT